jgi:two-component system, LytTR family, sensor kinase
MKKVAFHMAFWAIYFFQSALLIFFVNLTRLNEPTLTDLTLAATNCLVILLPKVLFTYFILYWALDKILAGAQQKGIVYAISGLLGSIILYRALVVYFVNPVIYHWDNGQTVFSPLGLLVALMDIGFISGAAIVIKQARLQYAGREREKALVREKLEAELKFLRNQTNPHFLFNTLNNIYALARKKSDQTPEVVLKLSKLLRFMLYESSKPLIKIEDEIRILDDYIELEKLRYNSRLTVNFYREIDNFNEEISPLLLLPFVENAFKHGPSESHFDAYIHIDMILQDSILMFNVENTKERSEGQEASDNIGLGNVKRQLQLTYSEYNMQIDNEEALFRVSLSINLKTHEKNQLSYTGR